MKQLIWCLLVLMPVSVLAQNKQGIQFEKILDRQKVFAKANAEQKYVMFACFNPKQNGYDLMEKNVFSQMPVYDFFNAHFISLNLQIDSTTNQDLIRAYVDQYPIKTFPVFLFFNAAGELVDKRVGTVDAKTFLAYGKMTLDTSQQYYKLRERFLKGQRTRQLVVNIMPFAVDHSDSGIAIADHDPFWEMVDYRYNKANLDLICRSFSKSTDQGFNELVRDTAKINKILGEQGRAQGIIKGVLKVEMYHQFVENKPTVNWAAMAAELNRIAPDYTSWVVLNLRMFDAAKNNRWEDWAAYQLDYYDEFFPVMDHNERFFMNNTLFAIFNRCFDQKVLKRASAWSKVTIGLYVKGEEGPVSMDTYANLLYKLGKRKRAVQVEERSMQLLKARNDTVYLPGTIETLRKMKKGLPTWESK